MICINPVRSLRHHALFWNDARVTSQRQRKPTSTSFTAAPDALFHDFLKRDSGRKTRLHNPAPGQLQGADPQTVVAPADPAGRVEAQRILTLFAADVSSLGVFELIDQNLAANRTVFDGREEFLSIGERIVRDLSSPT